MIQIVKAKVEQAIAERNTDGTIKITGTYNLINEKGDSVAKQGFNGYSDKKFEFDRSIGKNFIEDLESAIEIEIGIQEAIKNV